MIRNNFMTVLRNLKGRKLSAALVSLALALPSIGYHVVRASRSDPVYSLRRERTGVPRF